MDRKKNRKKDLQHKKILNLKRQGYGKNCKRNFLLPK